MDFRLVTLQFLAIVLPIIGTALPGILKQDRLMPHWNGLIAFVIVMGVAAIQAWAAGQLGANIWLDYPIVVAGMSALLAGPFKPIDAYLQSNVGAGAQKAPQAESQS